MVVAAVGRKGRRKVELAGLFRARLFHFLLATFFCGRLLLQGLASGVALLRSVGLLQRSGYGLAQQHVCFQLVLGRRRFQGALRGGCCHGTSRCQAAGCSTAPGEVALDSYFRFLRPPPRKHYRALTPLRLPLGLQGLIFIPGFGLLLLLLLKTSNWMLSYMKSTRHPWKLELVEDGP